MWKSVSPYSLATLILHRALCRKCIAKKTGLDAEAVDAVLVLLSQSAVKVDRYPNGKCLECGARGRVFAINRRQSK